MLTDRQLNRLLLIFGIFLFVSHLSPDHIHPYREYIHDALGGLAVLLAWGYLACIPKVTLKLPVLLLVPFGLIAVIVAQTLGGDVLFQVDSVFPVVYLVGFALAIVLGATIAAQDNGFDKLCNLLSWVYLAVGLVSVVFQNLQLFDIEIPRVVMSIHDRSILRPYANIAQPNLLALILCFALASVWWRYKAKQLPARIGVLFVLVLLWGLALTQARVAWLILPLLTVLAGQRTDNGRSVSKWLLLALLTVYAGLVLITPSMLGWVGVTVTSLSERAGQTGVRVVLWKQAWVMSVLHPWLGIGWYQFGRYQVMLAGLFPTAEYSEYAHNIVLNLAAEIGWPLTIATLGGFSYWFYQTCVRFWRNAGTRYLSLIIVAAMVHSLVEFPLWNGFLLFPFGVMLGALNRPAAGERVETLSRYWVAAVCSAGLIFVSAASWDYVRVVLAFSTLEAEQRPGYLGPVNTTKPDFSLYAQFFDYCHVPKIAVRQGMNPEEIAFLERASLRFGFPSVLMRLALAYAYNNRQNEALQVLTSIQHLHPSAYEKTYSTWAEYAKQDPNFYTPIFSRMPAPVSRN